VDEKRQIARRLREEALAKFGSIKALAESIGKTPQYLNVYLSGVNAPGPKMRRILEKAGLDVAYIMTGRRGIPTPATEDLAAQVMELMEELGIESVEELRERLEEAERLRHLLGADAYSTMLDVASVKEQRGKYPAKKRRKKQ
jgi:transcriptional regulator with XRE-family HTH domain